MHLERVGHNSHIWSCFWFYIGQTRSSIFWCLDSLWDHSHLGICPSPSLCNHLYWRQPQGFSPSSQCHLLLSILRRMHLERVGHNSHIWSCFWFCIGQTRSNIFWCLDSLWEHSQLGIFPSPFLCNHLYWKQPQGFSQILQCHLLLSIPRRIPTSLMRSFFFHLFLTSLFPLLPRTPRFQFPHCRK